MRFIRRLKASADFAPALAWHEELPGRDAAFSPLDRPLDPRLAQALAQAGIERLYTHQAQAINAIRAGQNVLTATPTASGKTLIYNLPVFDRVLAQPAARALYLFPLKALERDQLKTIRALGQRLGPPAPEAAVYDGDTRPHERKKIRQNPPHVLITNPDMLHLSLLAYHDAWRELWTNLEFVVLDEVHTYRGVFGGHMAQVLRRLSRVLDLYGARPRFILSSATIGNPEEFAQKLTGRRFAAILESGAPERAKHFLFVNPQAQSAAFTAARLMTMALHEGLRTIAFTQSRRLTELMHMWTAQLAPDFAGRISSYRAGFLPSERREIERGLASGSLMGVISTSALELGLDIGELEVCLLVGYPGSLMRTFQRGGRVGRADKPSVVTLVAQPDALDQYFMRHPSELFTRPFEPAVLDPDNEPITLAHLACAADESPLLLGDLYFKPGEKPKLMARAVSQRLVLASADGNEFHAARRRPHQGVNIRATGEGFTILDESSGRVIGSVDSHRVFKECHEGAIYPHRAASWLVTRLNLAERNVHAQRVKVNYYTRPRTEKDTDILETLAVKPVANFLAKLGRLRVRERVTGFEKRLIRGQELMGTFALDLPERAFETEGLWFEIEDFVPASLTAGLHFMGGIHAIEHAAIGLFPLLALSDRDDMGGISMPFNVQLGKGAVFIYDGHEGGVGLARKGFEVIEELLAKTLETIEGCGCETGCPSCIHSPKCGSGNKPLDKQAAVAVLKLLLGRQQPVLPTPRQEPEPPPPVIKEKPRKKPRPHFVAFDLETRRSAAEVGGWSKAHLMGLSLAVVYDWAEDGFFTYHEEDADALVEHLAASQLIIGFNHLGFDYQVLKAYTPLNLSGLPNLDLLSEIHSAAGRRVSLDHLGEMNLGRKKTANGLMALEWYKQGRLDLIEEYCRQDVSLTWELFVLARDQGHLLIEAKNGSKLRIPLDFKLERFYT